MASYSVTFADGTSHAYDDVPEGVTQAEIDARAAQDFPNKKVKEIGTAKPPEPEYQPSPGVAAAGGVQTGAQIAWDAANGLLSSPVGHALELGAGGVAAYRGLKNITGNWGAATQATPTPTPTTFTGGTNPAFDQAMNKPYMRPTVPGQPVVGAPQTAGIGQDLAGTAPTAPGFMGRVAPYLETAGKLANKVLTPALIAKELYYTSPEERAQLQQMEQNHTTLKDWTKQKLGMGNPAPQPMAAPVQPQAAPAQPQASQQTNINDAIRIAAAKKALGQ